MARLVGRDDYQVRQPGPAVINPIVDAEVAAGFDDLDVLDEALSPDFLKREPLPWPAGFLAGHAFVRYRQLGGQRPSVLPDFYIGAHAAVAGHTLLTRDSRRYRYSFPKLRIVAPSSVPGLFTTSRPPSGVASLWCPRTSGRGNREG